MRRFRSPIAAVVMALSVAGLMATGCVPHAPAPACPTVPSGTWTGSWHSDPFGIGGPAVADLTVTGNEATGTVTLQGSTIPGAVAFTATIDCYQFSAVASGGVGTVTATISGDGLHINGHYDAPFIPDYGTLQLSHS